MRKITIGIMFFILGNLPAIAGDNEFAVTNISPVLLKNADVVIRLEERFVDLQALDKMFSRRHYVITVLNEQGAKFAKLVEWYDKFNEIRSIEGTLYDASGKKIKSLKNKDIEDLSGYSSMNLVDDSRFKVHDFYCKVYPYTVEYVIEEVKKESMFFPSWIPVWDEYVAVEKSNISIKVPQNYQLRYKEFNCPNPVLVTQEADKKLYSWSLLNFEAVKKEYAAPGWTKITPAVLLAPSNFVIEDYAGNMTDWTELGKFQFSLNQGKDVLPQNIKEQVVKMTASAKTILEKTTILYKFLQANTHYISIQLGIGGWRPFEASYVAQKAYGDCKALSNYMYALLKEAGIRAHYTLIKAGEDEDDIITDFPSRQFNHAIVCVPDGKDTIWLECTDQNKSAGYMGSFTGNRHALLITEDGGKLVTTPSYTLKENVQVRHTLAFLDDEATLNVKVNTVYKAMQQDDLDMMLNSLSKDKIKEVLHEQLDLSTYDINNFDYKVIKSSLPQIEESLDITVKNYATITGKRLFIIPNIMSRANRKLPVDTERKYDLELKQEFQDIDTMEIELPAGYETEAVPKDVSLLSKFGKYTCSISKSSNKLIYYRHYEHYKGQYPAADYPELVKFYEAVYKADRNKVVLVKKDTTKGF
ncbi:MAG: DUF3857 domain-containing protein [Chitinophagaceae bacterium]